MLTVVQGLPCQPFSSRKDIIFMLPNLLRPADEVSIHYTPRNVAYIDTSDPGYMLDCLALRVIEVS